MLVAGCVHLLWGLAHTNAHLCTQKYFLIHFSGIKGRVTTFFFSFLTVGCQRLRAVKQRRRKALQG